MLIHCTKKLLDELKITPSTDHAGEDPLFSWRANIITVNRRKTLVLMCELNRYVVVLYGLKAKDFKEIDKQIVEAIGHALLKDHVNPAVVERYLAEAGEVVFSKKTDRTQTARLTKACESVHFAIEHGKHDSIAIGMNANNYLVGGTNNDFFYPTEKMMEDLTQLGIEPVCSCSAFELTVRLELDRYDAIRKLVVPADITFVQLHKILQAAFDWQNYHLYDFCLFEHVGQNQPNLELVMNEEDLAYRDSNARLMEDIQLSEYLPQYKHLIYHYDFGDDWHHYIEVTNVIDNSSESRPVLIAGEGNAPPEDVGGIGGYAEFLRIISDPADENHSYLSEWGDDQGYCDFDFDQISRHVKYALK